MTSNELWIRKYIILVADYVGDPEHQQDWHNKTKESIK